MAHIPKRMCIACRGMFEKGGLIRLVKEDNEVVIDLKNKKPGRGAYICKNEDCILLAKKKRAIQSKLKTAVPDSIYERLSGEL